MQAGRGLIAQWLLVCSLATALPGCAGGDPEQALRASVSGLQAAVETREAAAIEKQLAEDFVGPDGLDRQGARRLAQMVFLRHRSVSITLGPLDVAMQKHHATVRFPAVLTGGPGGLIPQAGQVYQVETGWRLQDGDWKLTSAMWTPQL